MPPTKAQLFKVKVQSFKSNLEKSTNEAKQQLATTSIAENYNTLRDEVAAAFPTINESLPPRIRSTTLLSKAGKSDNTYLDLEIFVDQLIGILSLFNSDD